MKQIITIVIILLNWNIQAQSFDQNLKEKLDLQIAKYVDGISPGTAVGIVRDGEIVYQKNIGYSNLENKIEINEKTSFNIASNAKQYTALCILKLIEEGKLKLEEDIRVFLPDLYQNIDDKITISNLLDHSSGIRDVYDLWALKGQTWWKLFIDNKDAIELINAQNDLNFRPGSAHIYSNSNYILLTEIVKIVSGKNFSEFALDLFRELGMKNTAFLTNYMTVIPNKARPYGNWNGWKEYPLITETHGDGALFTTLQDQLKWEIIIQNAKSASLPQEIIAQCQQPNPNSSNQEYGYGLMFGIYKGMNYSFHDGSTGAYNATFLRFPDKNFSFVVISNNGNVPTNYLAKQLVDICFDLQNDITHEFPRGPDKTEELNTLTEVVGKYKTQSGTIINIIENEGSLYREIYQRDPVKLINRKGNLFHYETNKDLKIAFTTDENGQREFTIYLSSQAPNVGMRLPSIELNNDYYSSLDGKYYNDETETEILIKYIQDNRYSITKNGREREGELIIKDLLRMNSYQIKINRDKEGHVNRLLIKNGRIQNVVFNKK